MVNLNDDIRKLILSSLRLKELFKLRDLLKNKELIELVINRLYVQNYDDPVSI
jgi:hypothetical protein